MLGNATFAHTSVSDVAVDPTNPGIVVASTTVGAAGRYATVFPHGLPAAPPRGVFKSVDGGATWSQRLNGDATSVEVDRANFARMTGTRRRSFWSGAKKSRAQSRPRFAAATRRSARRVGSGSR